MTYIERYGPWGLVVGASEGLGLALASELAARGVNLVIVARRSGLLEEAAGALRAKYAIEVRTISADASDAQDMLHKIEKTTGDIELGFMIYACASEHGGEFLQLGVPDHLNHIAVNCITPTVLVHRLGGDMVRRGRGGIVLCSSLAAMQGIYRWASYAGSKAYEMLLGESLWDEFGLHGVGACAFMIGTTYTPNFIRNQVERGTIYAKGRVPEGAPAGMQLPQLPEEAAANLFRQLDQEWVPLVFANPLDEARHELLKHQDRASEIKRISDQQRSGYRSLLENS